MMRLGKTEDANAIAKLLVDTWQKCYQDFLPQSFLENLSAEKQTQRHLAKLENGIQYLVNEDHNNTLTGFASFGKSRDTELKTEMELYTLYVDSNHQRKGIGKSLLEKILKENKNQSIGVLVMKQNPFLSFYLKNGFVITGKQEMDLGNFKTTNLIFKKN